MSDKHNLLFCVDCHFLESTGDATYFDGAYEKADADVRLKQCSAGLNRVARIGDLYANNSGGYIEFSRYPCDSCCSVLAGSRYEWTAQPKPKGTNDQNRTIQTMGA